MADTPKLEGPLCDDCLDSIEAGMGLTWERVELLKRFDAPQPPGSRCARCGQLIDESDAPEPKRSYFKGWRWFFVTDWNPAGRWHLGIEFVLGWGWPRNWSLYFRIGPLFFGGGLEQNFDITLDELDALLPRLPEEAGT